METIVGFMLAVTVAPQLVWQALTHRRKVYHATPLHYLPSILYSGELVCAKIGRKHGIAARATAERRDRMLGLDRYVHFSLDAMTPLLLDKLARGMPHVLMEFDLGGIVSGGYSHALLPFNTKAWHSRSAYVPITDFAEMVRLMKHRDEFGRYSSMEFLVESRVSLASLTRVMVFSNQDRGLVQRLIDQMGSTLPVDVFSWDGIYADGDDAIRMRRCLEECIETGRPMPLPTGITFD